MLRDIKTCIFKKSQTRVRNLLGTH